LQLGCSGAWCWFQVFRGFLSQSCTHTASYWSWCKLLVDTRDKDWLVVGHWCIADRFLVSGISDTSILQHVHMRIFRSSPDCSDESHLLCLSWWTMSCVNMTPLQSADSLTYFSSACLASRAAAFARIAFAQHHLHVRNY
jgi:hypothetical protein